MNRIRRNATSEVKVKVAQSCPTLCDPMEYTWGPWSSPGQNTGVGTFSHLQGNLPIPGIKPRSPALLMDSLLAEPQGKPNNTGVGTAYLFFRGSSRPKNGTGIPCTAGGFFTN